eukprot:Em0014g730a
MHRVLRFPVSRCRSSPVATVQFGRILSSKQFDPFVWPGASDPPAAAKKLDTKEDLKQLSDQLREMKEDAFSNTMRFTIQNALMGKIEVEVYCDEWPQFKAVAARITTPTVADVVLYTKSNESALGLLYDGRILKCPGSHISGGVIFAEIKDSLAQYLIDNIKSKYDRLLSIDTHKDKEAQSTILQYSRKHKQPQKIPCPHGYVIKPLRPEHAEFISRHWRFNDTTRKCSEKFGFIIKNFPSSAVYPHTESGESPDPVGWALLYPHGHIGHLTILEEHQKKNLFKPLALDLVSNVWSEEYLPELASDNVIVVGTATKNGFAEITKGRRLIYQLFKQRCC